MLQWTIKYLVSKFIALTVSPGRQISHILEYGIESIHWLLSQLLLVQKFLQERLFDGFPRILPQGLTGGSAGRGKCDGSRHCALWRWPGNIALALTTNQKCSPKYEAFWVWLESRVYFLTPSSYSNLPLSPGLKRKVIIWPSFLPHPQLSSKSQCKVGY